MRRGDNSDDNAGNSRARGEPFGDMHQQRPTCSRRRPYIPAAVPAQWLRLMIFGRPDIKCSHHMGTGITISRQDRHFSLGAPHRPIAFRFHKSLLFLVNFFQDDTSAVADNTLTIRQKSILPVSKTRQDKSLFRSLSGAYLPPLESGFVSHLLCSYLALMGFRRTCATTIRHRFPLTPVIRST